MTFEVPARDYKKNPRSYFDPGDYKDNEPGGGPLMVDSSVYEPTEQLIKRLSRAGELRRIAFQQASEKDIDAAFNAEDPTLAPDYDLADANEAQQSIKDARQSRAKARRLKAARSAGEGQGGPLAKPAGSPSPAKPAGPGKPDPRQTNIEDISGDKSNEKNS